MKKRTARLAALGLSAIFIASTVSFPVHAAEVPEDSGSSLSASKNSPEDTKEAPAEEEPALEELPEEEAPALKELPEEDLPKSEELPVAEDLPVEEDLPIAEDLPAKEELKVEEAPISLEDEAADEDSNDETPESRLSAHKPDMDPHDFDFDEAAQTIENAVQTSDDAKQNTADASSHTENVVAVVSKEQTTSDEAALAIENAKATVEEAKATFDQAETNYNEALDAYNQAVEAYNAILEEYNTEKELTAAELKEAEQALNEAMDAVDELEAELRARKAELIEAGATGLLSIRGGSGGSASHAIDMDRYISTVIQYYYIPETEKLGDGQSISDFTVYNNESEDGETNYIVVEYKVLGAKGEVIRTGAAEYQYEIDEESGEVKVSTREKVYHYTNKDGKEVYLTKDQAEALAPENVIQVDSYWAANGKYVLRYVNSETYYNTYYGDRNVYENINSRIISDGKKYWEDQYNSPRKGDNYYNVTASFNSGHKQFDGRNTITVDLAYNVYYDIVGEYIDVPDYIANTHYSSEGAVKGALSNYALSSAKGVYGIDYSASAKTLDISEQAVYAEVKTDYQEGTFSDALSEMVNSYYRLLNTVTTAKRTMTLASNRYNTLLQKMNTIEDNYVSIIDTSAIVTTLETQLEKAENNYVEASDNLVQAEENLEQAKTLFEERFALPVLPEMPEEPEVILPIISEGSSDESEEEVMQEEEEEELEIEEELIPLAPVVGYVGGSSGSDYGTSESVEELVEELTEQPTVEEQVPSAPVIEEEEEKEAITLAGLLERGKWFVGLAGVSSAGAGVAAFEAKRRAAIKLIDKLNQ